MRVVDVIADRLVEKGIRHVFMITGGGAMNLNDALGRHPGLEVVFCHHEQACAIAAEGCVRATGRPVAVNVTTGPGGTNALTGLLGQWTDSIPVLYLSGQVKLETSVQSCPTLGLRQLGDQEVDILRLVTPLTKFATSLLDPRQARSVVDRALYIATHGRPGPVWIDIPGDVQSAQVAAGDLEDLPAVPDDGAFDVDAATRDLADLWRRLVQAERPVLVPGHGVRLAGAIPLLEEVVALLGIPVVATFNGVDLLPSDHPCRIGPIGTVGSRAGNFALQNADLVIQIGTRNNIRQVSYNGASFARQAFKVVVDLDPAELRKPTFRPDLPIHADAAFVLRDLKERGSAEGFRRGANWDAWLDWCAARRARYPFVLDDWRTAVPVNPYHAIDTLTGLLGSQDIVVAGNGTACVALFQAGRIHRGQRVFFNSGCASMGYDLPAAIGAAVGSGRRVVCLAGDGSLQMNLQELQTLVHRRLPVKLFVLDNGGYASIRQTQHAFFPGPLVGCDADSGVSFPDMVRVAEAYGLPAWTVDAPGDLARVFGFVLDAPGPAVCVVRLDPDAPFSPKLSSERRPDGRMVSKPLEDMWPFLGREEFRSNMIVPPQEEP